MNADPDDEVITAQKQHVMEHVADFNAPPVVEFTEIHMEFHPDSHQRPDGPIPIDLTARDENGNPKQQKLQIKKGAITRLCVKFRVL